MAALLSFTSYLLPSQAIPMYWTSNLVVSNLRDVALLTVMLCARARRLEGEGIEATSLEISFSSLALSLALSELSLLFALQP